jgi:uncharacterized protein (DUF433 family)
LKEKVSTKPMNNDEALKMERCQGIDFVDGVTGRRARIAGTGIEVWEVIEEYNEIGSDAATPAELKEAFSHLTERQLVAAVNYYRSYPDEINERIQFNESLTPETVEAEKKRWSDGQ